MKPNESPRIRKKSIRGDSGDSRPVWNRGICWVHFHVLSSVDFFQNQLFQNIVLVIQLECQTVWIQIRKEAWCDEFE